MVIIQFKMKQIYNIALNIVDLIEIPQDHDEAGEFYSIYHGCKVVCQNSVRYIYYILYIVDLSNTDPCN